MGPLPVIELDYRFEKVRLKSRVPSNPIERFGALASQSVSMSPSLVPFLPVGRAERIAAGSLDPAWFRAEQVVEPSGEIVRLRSIDHGSKPLVEYAYDGLGRPSEIILLGNLREKYTWSDEGNIIRIAGRDIEATSFSYGDHGLLSRVKYPDGSIFSYSYDAERRLTHITYPDGCQVTRTHNENGQLQFLSTQDARFEFQWDGVRALRAIRFSTAKHSHELICARSRKSATFDFTGGNMTRL